MLLHKSKNIASQETPCKNKISRVYVVVKDFKPTINIKWITFPFFLYSMQAYETLYQASNDLCSIQQK